MSDNTKKEDEKPSIVYAVPHDDSGQDYSYIVRLGQFDPKVEDHAYFNTQDEREKLKKSAGYPSEKQADGKTQKWMTGLLLYSSDNVSIFSNNYKQETFGISANKSNGETIQVTASSLPGTPVSEVKWTNYASKYGYEFGRSSKFSISVASSGVSVGLSFSSKMTASLSNSGGFSYSLKGESSLDEAFYYSLSGKKGPIEKCWLGDGVAKIFSKKTLGFSDKFEETVNTSFNLSIDTDLNKAWSSDRVKWANRAKLSFNVADKLLVAGGVVAASSTNKNVQKIVSSEAVFHVLFRLQDARDALFLAVAMVSVITRAGFMSKEKNIGKSPDWIPNSILKGKHQYSLNMSVEEARIQCGHSSIVIKSNGEISLYGKELNLFGAKKISLNTGSGAAIELNGENAYILGKNISLMGSEKIVNYTAKTAGTPIEWNKELQKLKEELQVLEMRLVLENENYETRKQQARGVPEQMLASVLDAIEIEHRLSVEKLKKRILGTSLKIEKVNVKIKKMYKEIESGKHSEGSHVFLTPQKIEAVGKSTASVAGGSTEQALASGSLKVDQKSPTG